jgi:hypothetical protein
MIIFNSNNINYHVKRLREETCSLVESKEAASSLGMPGTCKLAPKKISFSDLTRLLHHNLNNSLSLNAARHAASLTSVVQGP